MNEEPTYSFTTTTESSNVFEEELLSFMEKERFVNFTIDSDGVPTYWTKNNEPMTKEEFRPETYTYKVMEELEELYDQCDFESDNQEIQVTITRKQLEAYKRADQCCRELRYQLSMACNWDSHVLMNYLVRWLNKADENKWKRP